MRQSDKWGADYNWYGTVGERQFLQTSQCSCLTQILSAVISNMLLILWRCETGLCIIIVPKFGFTQEISHGLKRSVGTLQGSPVVLELIQESAY